MKAIESQWFSFDHDTRTYILNEHFCGNSQETITCLNEANWSHSRSWRASRCRLVRRTRRIRLGHKLRFAEFTWCKRATTAHWTSNKAYIGTFLIRARRASIRHDTFPVATIRSSPHSSNRVLVYTLLFDGLFLTVRLILVRTIGKIEYNFVRALVCTIV